MKEGSIEILSFKIAPPYVLVRIPCSSNLSKSLRIVINETSYFFASSLTSTVCLFLIVSYISCCRCAVFIYLLKHKTTQNKT